MTWVYTKALNELISDIHFESVINTIESTINDTITHLDIHNASQDERKNLYNIDNKIVEYSDIINLISYYRNIFERKLTIFI